MRDIWAWVENSERRCWVCGTEDSDAAPLVIDGGWMHEELRGWICPDCRAESSIGRPA